MLANSISMSSSFTGWKENYYALALAILGRKDPDGCIRFPETAEQALDYILYGKRFRGVVAEDFLEELDPEPVQVEEDEPEQIALCL